MNQSLPGYNDETTLNIKLPSVREAFMLIQSMQHNWKPQLTEWYYALRHCCNWCATCTNDGPIVFVICPFIVYTFPVTVVKEFHCMFPAAVNAPVVEQCTYASIVSLVTTKEPAQSLQMLCVALTKYPQRFDLHMRFHFCPVENTVGIKVCPTQNYAKMRIYVHRVTEPLKQH